MNKENSIIKELNSIKEIIKYTGNSIKRLKESIKDNKSQMLPDGFNKQGLNIKVFLDNDIEILQKRENDLIKECNELNEIENKIKVMLKYFNSNMPLIKKGMVLKLLNKEYNNRFHEKGLKGYSVKLYEMINFAIDNNIGFYLQFKTLENECIKSYNETLKEWL